MPSTRTFPPAGLDQAENHPRQRGFAGAGFAHQPQRLAGFDGQGHILDDVLQFMRRPVQRG